MSSEREHDIVIVGGGFVGLSLALALAQHGRAVTVIEARSPATTTKQGVDQNDIRGLALAATSQQLLQRLGVWQELMRDSIAPIEQIHVSEQGRFGCTRLQAQECHLTALGYVVHGQDLVDSLSKQAHREARIHWIAPAQLEDFAVLPQQVTLKIRAGAELRHTSCQLLVAAEGVHSGIREQLGITVAEHDYGSQALVTSVSPTQPNNTAYERFTPEGPVAFLPLPKGRYAVIWTAAPEKIAALQTMTDPQLLQHLQASIGYRLGRLTKLGTRRCYPLQGILAEQQVHERIVLMGSAAHHFHPAAGQGLNLSWRDVALLVELIVEQTFGPDPGSAELLSAYEAGRRGDQRQVVRATHGLLQLFESRLPGLGCLRSLGLLALDASTSGKKALVRRASGLQGHSPKLVCGIPLQTMGQGG